MMRAFDFMILSWFAHCSPLLLGIRSAWSSHALQPKTIWYVWSCLWKAHHLVRSGLYGEAWPSLSNLFRTGPGKLWFALSGSVQIWPATFWSGLTCKVWFCLVSSGLLLSAWIWSAWEDLVCCWLVRFSLVSCDWFGLLGLVLYGPVRTGLIVLVQVLFGLARFNCDCSKLIWSGFFCFGLFGFCCLFLGWMSFVQGCKACVEGGKATRIGKQIE